MMDYLWKFNFKFDNLLVDHHVKSSSVEFNSPFFPSTKQTENYTEGQLSINWNSSDYSVKEFVVNGLEVIVALTNCIYVPCQVELIDSPPGLIGLTGQINAYTTHKLNEAENLPKLWRNYTSLQPETCIELIRSIRWYMRSIKANDPIDKFIYAWITFNMLYSWLTEAPGDNHKKGIKGLTGKGTPSIKKQKEIVLRNESILSEIAQNNFTDRHGIDRAKKLRDSLPTDNPTKILEGAIEAIGFIRHNIFHGSLIDKTSEAERCIWPLTQLNSEIIKQQLQNIV